MDRVGLFCCFFFFFQCQAYIYYFISFLQEPNMVSILQLSEKDAVAQRGSITEPRAEAILPRAGRSHSLSPCTVHQRSTWPFETFKGALSEFF